MITRHICYLLAASPPCRIEVVSWKPRAFVYHNFLSDAEAEHIKKLAAPTVSSSKTAAAR
jgi:hypothetical protein